MATDTTILAHLGRLWVNYRIQLSDVDASLVESEWLSAFGRFEDEAIRAATETWLLREEWMPTIAGFLDQVQSEQRAIVRATVDHALPSGPRNDEPLADSHAWAETIRIATGLVYVEPDMRARGGDLRGHDHHRGAEHCPICSGQRRIESKERPFVPPKPQWSTCSECDGSHYVEVDGPGLVVRPCSRCNGFAYSLWIGGHYEPGHRCDECAPVGRRRKKEDA